jgi:hypothetical protein
MLRQSIPNYWNFAASEQQGLSIRRSCFTGAFDLCLRAQIGEMCWETRTLSAHKTLEKAVAAAAEHSLVASR